jgi:hypothetical protein
MDAIQQRIRWSGKTRLLHFMMMGLLFHSLNEKLHKHVEKRK